MARFSKEKHLKKVFGLAALISLGTVTYSAEWLFLKDKNYKIVETEKILEVDDSISDKNYSGILVKGNSIIDGTSLKKLDIIVDRENVDYSLIKGIEIKQDENRNAQFIADNLAVTINPVVSEQITAAIGIHLNDGANFKAKDLNINLIHSNEKEYDDSNIKNDIYGTTGIVLDKGLPYEAKPTLFEANNVTINVSNTKDSDNDLYEYDLSGIDIMKAEKKYGGDTSFKINQNLNIKVEDKSSKQNLATLFGIYMAAVDTEINLNNTNISLTGAKNSSLASGIGIGIIDDLDFKTSGKVNSKGKLNIDTTGSLNATSIAVAGSGGEIKANFEKSSSDIKTAGTAIVYKGPESFIDKDDTKEDRENLRKIIGKNQVISLKDAKITTTYSGKNEKSNPTTRRNLIYVEKGVSNATLNLSGANTEVKAGDFYNSTLINVKENSDLTVNLSDKAFMEGMIDRMDTPDQTKGETAGKVKLTVSDGATWKLQNKSSKSRLNEIVLKSGGTLDVTNIIAKEEYDLMFDSDNGNVSFLNDGGIINMSNKSYEDILIIDGNYEGKNGAVIKMNTLWNAPNTSKSDLIKIYGNKNYPNIGKATGVTTVVPVGINGEENLIDGDIKKVSEIIKTVPVIKVWRAAENTFIGKAKTTGAGEVQLSSKEKTEGEREFFWVTEIVSNKNTGVGNKSNTSTKTPDSIKIYSTAVPAYVDMPKINMNLGFNTIGTLNERRGENEKIKDKNGQTWLRFIGKNNKEDGKIRFNSKAETYGIQAGYDFIVKENETSKQNTGFYIAHTETKVDFSDRYRAENGKLVTDKYTGAGKVKDLSLGLTTTKYYKDGLYFDLVGQFSVLENKYTSRDRVSAKQKGKSFALSAELGKAYKLSNNWNIEPQTQLIYQYLKLKDFNDGIKKISYGNDGTVRGRVGIRVSNQFIYGLANIWHNFDTSTKTNIGKDKIKEKYFATSGEIGLGVQYSINASTYIFGDMRYEKSFKANSKNNSYRGTLGIKYSW